MKKLLIAACLASAGTALWAEECSSFYAQGMKPVITKPAMQSMSRELCYTEFAVMHSGMTRTPLWSAQYLTPAKILLAQKLPRKDDFHSEKLLPDAERAELSDYENSGYDRGHLAPANDMPDSVSQKESFSLANMVPQYKSVNRGLWAGIEDTLHDAAMAGRRLYVITGPLFEGASLQQINKRVMVPTAMFKAVYDPAKQEAAAYVVSNNASLSLDQVYATARYVSIAELETRAGINLFPHMSSDAKTKMLALPSPSARYGVNPTGTTSR